MKIKPINNFVIVLMDKEKAGEEQTASGIYIPDRARMPKKTGTVQAVGRGLVTASGAIVPPQCKPGDRVHVMDTGNLKEIEHDSKACVILPDETLILGIVSEEGK